MKTNQKGFSIVEILIVLAVVGLIGGAGWYVWQSKNKDTKTENRNTSSLTEKNTTEQSLMKKELETFTTDTGVRFSYPKESELEHYSWDYHQKKENIPASRGYLETTQLIVRSKEYQNVYACIEFTSAANNDNGLPRINPVKVTDFTPMNDKQLELYSHTNGDEYALSLGKNQASITDNKGYPVTISVSLNCLQGSSESLKDVKKPFAELDVISEAIDILATVSTTR